MTAASAEQFAARAAHRHGEHLGQVRPIVVLELMHQAARDIAIDRGRSRAAEGRRIGQGGG